MHDEDLEARFLEAWQRTGDEYLTRKEIAREFGYSDGWVQLMLIRTKAKPRRISVINKQRLDFGVDLRQFNRRKNLVKYWARHHILDLNEAEVIIQALVAASLTKAELRVLDSSSNGSDLKKAKRKRKTALRGLERQYRRLKKLLHAKDPFLKYVKDALNDRS
jgi:hypothetical protein